jgi:hypothetical protein
LSYETEKGTAWVQPYNIEFIPKNLEPQVKNLNDLLFKFEFVPLKIEF